MANRALAAPAWPGTSTGSRPTALPPRTDLQEERRAVAGVHRDLRLLRGGRRLGRGLDGPTEGGYTGRHERRGGDPVSRPAHQPGRAGQLIGDASRFRGCCERVLNLTDLTIAVLGRD
jgi:hypothetical protein